MKIGQLKRLESDDLKFFCINDEPLSFTYFTFISKWPRNRHSYWDIVGLRQRSDLPRIFEVRLIHIEEEMLDWPPFEAVRDAPGYIMFDPMQFQALISFFESLLGNESVEVTETAAYFSPMKAEDLASVHYPENFIASRVDRCYRYFPDGTGQNDEYISYVCFPSWSSRYGVHQISLLTFTTFPKENLADPLFNPVRADGLGFMAFNQPALATFVSLLKQHAYRENTTR